MVLKFLLVVVKPANFVSIPASSSVNCRHSSVVIG